MGIDRIARRRGGERRRRRHGVGLFAVAGSMWAAACQGALASSRGIVPPASGTPPRTAIVGATIIDGTGAAPLADATVLLAGRRIEAVGPRSAIRVPTAAKVIDGRGLFVLPGFVDVNVHLTLWGDAQDSTIAGYAADALHYGVTTARDSYGLLRPLERVRDRIRAGSLRGTRLLVAGNIVGWGGFGSFTNHGGLVPEPGPDTPTYSMNVRGAGEDLIGIEADSLRARINQYLDQGVDFIKYGGTLHGGPLMLFSSRAQRVIIEEAHKRGLIVDTHAQGSPEALGTAILAGVDLVQHPELEPTYSNVAMNAVVLPDDIVRLFVEHRVICAMNSPWWYSDDGFRLTNAKKLIAAGCTVAVASDELPGKRTLEGVIALVLQGGMSPMAALVAGTRNGARAAGMADRIGTVEPGKLADLVLVRADPLQDITNIRHVAMVFAEGARIEGKDAAVEP